MRSDADPVAALGDDAADGGDRGVAIAAGDEHVPSAARELSGTLEADSGVAAGHEDDVAAHAPDRSRAALREQPALAERPTNRVSRGAVTTRSRHPRAVGRRTFLRLLLGAPVAARTATAMGGDATGRRSTRAAGASPYGRWVQRDGLPAFAYDADQETLPVAEWDPILAPRTRRHWLMVGNRAIRLQAANDGTVALFDESYGLRWLVAPDPTGTGVSIVEDDAGRRWGSDYALRAGRTPPRRTFGPTWFEVREAHDGLVLERTILCPEGEVPWVLVRVRLTRSGSAGGVWALRHVERWALRPRFLNLLETTDQRRTRAAEAVTYDVSESGGGAGARAERFAAVAGAVPDRAARDARARVARRDGRRRARTVSRTVPHPVLEIETRLALGPGEQRDLWFRFGRQDAAAVGRSARHLALVAASPARRGCLAPRPARRRRRRARFPGTPRCSPAVSRSTT